MVKHKIAVLAVFTVLFSLSGSALLYEVEIGESLNHSTFELEYQEEIQDVQEISVVVENTGSVGCQFYLRNDMSSGNFSRTDYSQEYAIWPGNSKLMEMKSVPENVTGTVNSTLHLSYCGKTVEIAQYSFNDTRKTLLNNSLESKTLSAGSGEVSMELPVQNGSVVPIDAPSYWRTGSADIKSGIASVNLDAPIFNSGSTVEFAVINSTTERVVGTTQVSMTPEDDLEYIIRNSTLEIILGVSILLNTVLAARVFRDLIK